MSTEIEKLEKKLKKARKKAKKQAREAAMTLANPVQDGMRANAPSMGELPSTTVIQPGGQQTAISRLMPRDHESMKDLAQLMAKGGPMIGRAFRGSPGACAAIIMQAVRLQMDPFALSQEAYLVNDTVGYSGKAIAAMVTSNAPIKGRFRAKYEGDIQDRTRKVTILATFIGEDDAHEVDTPMLKDIKIQNSPLWKSDPDQQLYYYGVRAWARRWAPEVIMGLISDDEAAVAHELENPKTAAEKAVERMKQKKAAKELEVVEESAAEEAEEDLVEEGEFEEIEDVDDHVEEDAKPAVSPDSEEELSEGALDWLEALDMMVDCDAIDAAWQKQKKLEWFKAASQDQKARVINLTNRRLEEMGAT